VNGLSVLYNSDNIELLIALELANNGHGCAIDMTNFYLKNQDNIIIIDKLTSPNVKCLKLFCHNISI